MSAEPFETAEAQDTPTVRQQSVFVENRVGQLMRLTKLFDQADIRILALSVVHSVDCAICRMILDEPDIPVPGTEQPQRIDALQRHYALFLALGHESPVKQNSWPNL